jgi:threonine dehydrogenase-like Zn-dependent dehydrogenase
MTGTMRAAFFEGLHEIKVRDAAIPEPGPGDVRLKVRYCGICGSDLSLYKTGVLAGPDVILGHEIAAVVDLDPGGEWAAGTRVILYPSGTGCGECVWCKEGKYRYCMNPPPGQHGGGYAEYLAAPGRDLIPVPEDLDDRAAAAAEPLGVAARGVAIADPEPGDFAYVSGLGSIGLFSVASLAAAGCRVVGADPREERRALALEVGAEDVFDNTKEDPFAKVLTYDPKGPRVAFECAGVPDSLQQVFDACGPQGTVGILGIPMAPAFLLRFTLREQRAFSIQGPTPDSMRRALDILRNRPQTQKIVTGTVPLEETNEAFARLIEGSDGVKVLVDPEA